MPFNPICIYDFVPYTAGPEDKGGPGEPWPTHHSKMGLPSTGIWRKLPENGIDN